MISEFTNYIHGTCAVHIAFIPYWHFERLKFINMQYCTKIVYYICPQNFNYMWTLRYGYVTYQRHQNLQKIKRLPRVAGHKRTCMWFDFSALSCQTYKHVNLYQIQPSTNINKYEFKTHQTFWALDVFKKAENYNKKINISKKWQIQRSMFRCLLAWIKFHIKSAVQMAGSEWQESPIKYCMTTFITEFQKMYWLRSVGPW
jgi:hypothetical protein